MFSFPMHQAFQVSSLLSPTLATWDPRGTVYGVAMAELERLDVELEPDGGTFHGRPSDGCLAQRLCQAE